MTSPPSAQLFVGTLCPHCTAVMHGLTALLADLKTQMLVRTGISAVFEELAGSKALHDVIPELQQLTLSELSKARVSACHFLALAGDPDAIPIARRLLDDEEPNVREVARETLAVLDDTSPPEQALT